MDTILASIARSSFNLKDPLDDVPPDVRAIMQASKPQPDIENDTFGLHYPLPYAISTWQRYREHGLLPAAGGYDDQLAVWVEDMNMLDGRYHGHWKQAKTDWEATLKK